MGNKMMILFLLIVIGKCDFLDDIMTKTCPDEDLQEICQSHCETDYAECVEICFDIDCLLECGRKLTECSNDCPCGLNCPNGCNNCPNPICTCGEYPTPQNKDNLNNCVSEKSSELGQCYLQCKGNVQCGEFCWEEFKSAFESCPCQTDCYAGCPCDQFECKPDKKSLLVLNTYSSSNKPILIKFDGGENRNLEFTLGPNTSVYHSCSATLNGEFYVFGGEEDFKRQISKINGCFLQRVAQLPHDFRMGTCGTFLFADQKQESYAQRVMFCFAEADRKKCFSYNGQIHEDHPDSVFDHYYTTLGNIGDRIIAIGSYAPDNNEVELFDIPTNTWTTRDPFPYASYIRGYGVVSLSDSSILIIGGRYEGITISNVVKYKVSGALDQWSQIGYLQKPRTYHRTVINENRIYVVGGASSYPTEIWSLTDQNEIKNINIAEPTLVHYRYYPEIFLVNSDFCTRK